MSMNQNDTLQLAQEFLRRMGSDAEQAEIAKLFSETLEWDIRSGVFWMFNVTTLLARAATCASLSRG